MPQLGDMVRALDIGRQSRGFVRWVKCPTCGLERWIQDRKQRGNLPPKEPLKVCPKCRLKEWIATRNYSRSGHPRWKGGRCQRKTGYVVLLRPEHLRVHKGGYIFEHILVWEKSHNQPLPKGYIVHHINGIKSDNRPKNLLALPKSGHSPALVVKEVQKRLREVEAELAQSKMF